MRSIRKWARFLQYLGLALFLLPQLIWSYVTEWDEKYEEF